MHLLFQQLYREYKEEQQEAMKMWLFDKVVYLGHTEIIKYMTATLNFDVNMKLPNGGQAMRAIHLAVDNSDVKTVTVLLAIGARLDNPSLLFFTAVRKGNLELLKLLHSHYRVSSPSSSSSQHYTVSVPALVHMRDPDGYGKTLLHAACKHSDKKIFDYLLENNCRIFERDYRHRTILFPAIRSGKVDFLEDVVSLIKQRRQMHLINIKDHYVGTERLRLVSGRDEYGQLGHHFVEVYRHCLRRIDKMLKYGGSCDVDV